MGAGRTRLLAGQPSACAETADKVSCETFTSLASRWQRRLLFSVHFHTSH